jgi:nucleotide-binding universal stress UspA family protein
MARSTVLVPLDGSPLAEAALPYSEAVAAATNAPLCLVGVVPSEAKTPTTAPAVAPLEARSPLELVELAAMEDYLEITATTLRARGLLVATMLKVGQPADQILVAAAEEDAGMVVMATHGRAGVGRLLEGSVADALLRRSTRPTLLVRPNGHTGPPRPRTLRQLLVPLDGSALAETALAPAVHLATADTTLLLVRVESHDSEDAALAARRYLGTVQRRLVQHVHTATVVLVGAAADALPAFAQGEAVDLIVMSTHGRGGLGRAVLGSTADQIVRSGMPVLVVPPGAAAPG